MMKVLKSTVFVSVILISLGLFSACKSDVRKKESDLVTSSSISDYFLPEDSSNSIQSDVGDANFEFTGSSDVIVTNEDVSNANLNVSLSDFSSSDLFIYVDDILIEQVKNDNENIDIPINQMILSVAPGEHILTISQYEGNKEENKLINSVSKSYNVVFK